jgi:broad specificity phosphatase PhoE
MEQNPKTTLILIRHGETEWNRTGRWQGQLDVPLSDAGRRQARQLARRLAADRRRLDVLYSSDQSRALETAQIVGEAIGLSPATTPALREIDLGHWAGHTKPEIAQLFPQEWTKLEAGEDFPRGGGESYAIFQARILEWLIPTINRHAGQSVAVVSHGGVIRAILLHALNLQWKDRSQIPSIGNTSLTEVEVRGNQWEIVSVGATTGPEQEGDILPVNEGEVV